MGFFLLIQTAPATGAPTPQPQTVELSHAQMVEIGNQINGAAFWIGGLEAVTIFCLAALVFVAIYGGR